MTDVAVGSLPFREQIAFFRGKENLETNTWTDIWNEEHDKSFVIAGAMKTELLNDMRNAVDRVIADGVTLEQFRKDFDSIVEKHGWEYNGGRNWRTRVIYDTNLRTSYQAGRFAQLTDPDLLQQRPYWMYVHSDLVVDPREEHLAWNGLVLAHDDPFWDTNFPPNGWGCKCSVRPVGERQLKAMGKTGPDKSPVLKLEDVTVGSRGPAPRTVSVPKGVDPGFAYTPGRTAVEKIREVTAERLQSLPADLGAQMAESLPLLGSNVVPSFNAWRKSMEIGKPRNESMVIGAVKSVLIDKLKKYSVDLETASITAIDREMMHQDREWKKSATTKSGMLKGLTEEEIQRIPIIIDQYDAAFWDIQDPALVFAKSSLKAGRITKVIVRVNFLTRTVADKKVMTNSFRTAGFVDAADFNDPRYDLLDGDL